MHSGRWIWSLLLVPALVYSEPPTDPEKLKIYNHDKEWLSKFPSPFVATNIRGQGMQYAERRMAALDLVRQQRDFGVVSELMNEVEKKSFLSADIIDILAEWKARRALPLLKKVQNDKSYDKKVREKARSAVDAIQNATPEKSNNPYAEH